MAPPDRGMIPIILLDGDESKYILIRPSALEILHHPTAILALG